MKQWLKSRYNYKEFPPNHSHVSKAVWQKWQKETCLNSAIRITRDVQKNQTEDAHVCHRAFSGAFAKYRANGESPELISFIQSCPILVLSLWGFKSHAFLNFVRKTVLSLLSFLIFLLLAQPVVHWQLQKFHLYDWHCDLPERDFQSVFDTICYP